MAGATGGVGQLATAKLLEVRQRHQQSASSAVQMVRFPNLILSCPSPVLPPSTQQRGFKVRALTRKPEKTQQLFNHPNLEVRQGWVHAGVQGCRQRGVCGQTCRGGQPAALDAAAGVVPAIRLHGAYLEALLHCDCCCSALSRRHLPRWPPLTCATPAACLQWWQAWMRSAAAQGPLHSHQTGVLP